MFPFQKKKITEREKNGVREGQLERERKRESGIQMFKLEKKLEKKSIRLTYNSF